MVYPAHKNQQEWLNKNMKCVVLFFFFIYSLASPAVFAQYKSNMHGSNVSSKVFYPSQKVFLNRPQPQEKIVDLVVSYKYVNFGKTWKRAIVVNGQIPGPTLHFRQGDHVTINVYNHLQEGTSIHWHGVIVPWQMDGVENVSQKPIPPGCVFHYHFTLMQSGTYWYHAHTGLQEQEGLYGAFIIDPPHPPKYHYTKDYVVVLSDWNNTPAERVFKNLKIYGDYYAIGFPLQVTLQRFINDYANADPCERKKIIQDYTKVQTKLMGLYDLSDVAYDHYLLNGRTRSEPWCAPVRVGDIVRLRFIGAAASTIYRVKIPCTKMRVVQVQGNDVKPYDIDDFYLAPGETYDVLVKIEKSCPYFIYAESIDTLGKVYGALVSDPRQPICCAPIMPFPKPEPGTRKSNDDCEENCGKEDEEKTPKTEGTEYQDLTAAVPTNDPNVPICKTIKMKLSGDMLHYIWFINGLSEYKAKPICIFPNKRYRLIFTNETPMRHPMHLHGHWFILRNGHGAHDPLLHTIDVPADATVVADVDTDSSGQWFFHCHNLYHLASGMSRVFQYQTICDVAKGCMPPENYVAQQNYINRPIVRVDEALPLNCSLISHPLGQPQKLYFANLLDIGEDPFHNAQKITFKGFYGPDYNKLELFTNSAEVKEGRVQNADIDVFYLHSLSENWAIKGGANYFYRPAETPYWQPGIGIEGFMPFFIETDIRSYYHKGSQKLDVDLARNTQITNNFFIRTELRSILATKTVEEDDIGRGLNLMQYTIRPFYRLRPNLLIFSEYEHVQLYGALKHIQEEGNEPIAEDTLTFGLTILF